MSTEPGTASSLGPDQDSVDELVAVLTLEPIEENIYRGHHPGGGLARTFGGLTAAQALVAATRTVDPERRLHSLHSYFLRPGDPSIPTVSAFAPSRASLASAMGVSIALAPARRSSSAAMRSAREGDSA